MPLYRSGEHLDTEASRRGTTFYLVDQRVNMVPDVLGENVGSLHANVDRFGFSVIWTMDEAANILDTKVAKTVLRSRAAFSYAEAQQRIDGARGSDPSDDVLTRSLCTLKNLADRLRERRVAGGALRLASPEIKFAMEERAACGGGADGGGGADSEGSSDGGGASAPLPTDMALYVPLETNAMVEEFMLLANVSVAKIIKEAFPSTAAPPPPESRAVGFRQAARLALHARME